MSSTFDDVPVHEYSNNTEIELEDGLDSFPTDVQEFDPKIREHLEELNRFSTKINQLEKCFEVNKIELFNVLLLITNVRMKIPSFTKC